jgi:TolB-like protein/DNA-binding SARP family transcriptional activator/Flp pilus assembly protein TadD
LLLFFWPDSSQSKARHSLEQLLYALRSSLGDDVFASNNPVVLSSESITTDVGDFNEALTTDRLEDAVNAYRGLYLEGFYLDNAPEFERWVEEERARLKAKYVAALEQLAQMADAAGDDVEAVRWWRTLIDADPVSVRNAAGLMRALMRLGDHAAALQFAERYESNVTRELGTTAGPAIATLVAEARAAAGGDLVAATPGLDGLSNDARATATRPAAWIRTPASSPTRRAQSTIRRALVGGLIFAMATAVIVAIRSPDPVPMPRSIAVLPLTNVGNDSGNAVLVDALTEELITALSRITNLRVIGRSSSFMFRNSAIGTRRIADSLRVTHLIEGSIERGPEKLRVRVRLLDASNGVAIWSSLYEPRLIDWYTMQGDIATSVARELNYKFGGRVETLTQSFAANELYLKGRDPMNFRTDSAPRIALRQLEQAVALDSNFAAAYAAMPYMYFALQALVRTAAESRDVTQRALVVARKALAMAPNLPEAHVGVAVALTMEFRDLATAEAELRKALALGGAPRVHEHLGRVLMWTGRHRESLEEALRALDGDPLSPSAAADVGEGYCVNRRYKEGLAYLQRVADLTPPLRRVAGYLAVCQLMQGNWDAAIPFLERIQGSNPWAPLLGYALARTGDTARVRTLQRDAMVRWQQTGRGAVRLAVLAEALGDRDGAIEWLDRTDSEGPESASILFPFFEELHADPRFDRFRQKIGVQTRGTGR